MLEINNAGRFKDVRGLTVSTGERVVFVVEFVVEFVILLLVVQFIFVVFVFVRSSSSNRKDDMRGSNPSSRASARCARLTISSSAA